MIVYYDIDNDFCWKVLKDADDWLKYGTETLRGCANKIVFLYSE